jgi:hypothetical protein
MLRGVVADGCRGAPAPEGELGSEASEESVEKSAIAPEIQGLKFGADSAIMPRMRRIDR